jgi:hypothetical protein
MFFVSDQPMSLMSDAFKKASISLPAVKGNVRLESLSALAVDLVNQTNEELQGTVAIEPSAEMQLVNEKQDIIIPPRKRVAVKFKLKGASFASLNKKEISAKLIINGSTTKITGYLDLYAVPRAKMKNDVNGDLSKYDQALSVPLSQEHLFPIDAAANKLWTGPDDLNCRAYWVYDDDNFYFGVRVKDDKFVQEKTGPAIWENDCVQFAFDPLNDALSRDLGGSGGYDADDPEFGMALTKKGPQCFCWVSPNENLVAKLTDFPLVIRKLNENEVVYEVAVPWAKLGLMKPQTGAAFKFNFVVFDSDEVRKIAPYWLELAPGITGGKEPSFFKTFILMP